MARRKKAGNFSIFSLLVLLFVFFRVHASFPTPAAAAQDETTQEVAVNLTEGRVLICAASDGIIVATLGGQGEIGSRPPVVLALNALRAGVVMGAVEWVQPDSKDKPIRLDSEFPGIIATALNASAPHNYDNGASDIESIGVAMLERVRELAGQLHNKVNIGEDEPLIRIVLAGYVLNYGPEAWTIDYFIRQDALGNDIWRTRVLRPSYNQLYPPVKGQPHTLIEVRYPPANRAKDGPELLDLMRQNDPRLATIRAANQLLAKSVAFVADGQSQKSTAALDVTFLRGALPAITSPETKLTMAYVDFDKGFQWVIEPPKAERPPADTTPREPDAPTLRRKSDN